MTEFQNLIEQAYQVAKRGDWGQLEKQWSDSPILLNRCSRFVNPGSLWTFLHQAAYFGNESACRMLISRGASLTAATHDRKTPRHVAEEKGHAALGELLRRATVSNNNLWSAPVDPEVRPSSNLWAEAVPNSVPVEQYVAYGGGLVCISPGSRHYVDSFGRVLVGWHGTFDPPCGMDGNSVLRGVEPANAGS